MRSKPWLWLTALALLPASAVPVLGQPRPVGFELRVNGNTETKQRNPTAAFNAAGAALVVWENDRNGLRGRFYGSDGEALTSEFGLVANQIVPGLPSRGTEIHRKDAVVAFLPSGDFFLAWTEERSEVSKDIFFEDRQLVDRDAYIQKFTASGAAAGAPVRLHADATGFQSVPKILVRNGADAVAVWQSTSKPRGGEGGIYGRLIQASGQPSGAEFKISPLQGVAFNPAIAGNPGGEFAVTWEASDGNSQGAFVRLYNRAAAAKGAEIRVNSDVAGLQRRAVVAPVAGGGWLVVWQGEGIDAKHAHIFGQFLGGAGNLVGPQFRISQSAGEAQVAPSVAASAGGNFLVTWLDYKDVFPLGLYGVTIDKLGNTVGSEVLINTRPLGAHTRTSLAVSPSGKVMTPWEGYFTQKGRKPGIAARWVEFQ